VQVDVASAITSLPDDLLELRAFNADREIHVVVDTSAQFADATGARKGQRFLGRIRVDGEGEETSAFVEEHVLWGSSFTRYGEGGNSRMVLETARGTRIDMPSLSDQELDENHCITLQVRNYLDTTEAGDSFKFNDYRFVSFHIREITRDDEDDQNE